MKSVLALLSFAFLSFNAQAELKIVSTEHRDTESFKRVSEYLTGKPSDGRYSVFRSNPDSRDGFYVSLLADDKSSFSNTATVRMQFVRAGTQEIDLFEVPAENLRKKRILVGLTGGEWASLENRPVAWKIDLLDDNGSSLETVQSFLWSDPS